LLQTVSRVSFLYSSNMAQKVTVANITKHATAEDCWILINGKVYDLTKFAPNHPGGPDSTASMETLVESIYAHVC